MEDWHHAAPDEPAEWRQAADLSDYILTLSASQLTALTKELDGVIERWRSETRATPAEDARQVLLYLYSLPAPEGGVVSALTVTQAQRRFLILLALRWLPVGLMIPVSVL